MTKPTGGPAQGGPRPLEGSVTSAKATGDGLEVVVRLTNSGNRALHYIGAPRVVLYDPATQKLTVRLSDKGRTLVPGGLALLPTFRVIDPHSNAEIRIRLPETIVKLSDTQSPAGDVAMVEHRIVDAAEIEVDVAWAEVPFYQDPRHKDVVSPPAARWQKDEMVATYKRPPAT